MRFLAATLALFLTLSAVAEDPDDGPDASTLELIQRTEKLRGLKFEQNPKVRYWDDVELRKMVVEEFDAELPEEKAKRMQAVLFAFGLTPKDYDLRKEYLALMMEQIAGFYHPKTKMLCLIKGKAGKGAEEETVIVHELDHAMQDQHFDLTRLYDLAAKNDDMAQALKCLIEGEATMVMFDNQFRDQGMASSEVPGIEGIIENAMAAAGGMAAQQKLDAAPPVIKGGLVGAYIDGFKFCVGVKRKGGWDALNAVWSDIPVSTEQILHPARYLERDMPQTVTLPKKFDALDGWEKVEENVMGEFSVRMVFFTLKPKSEESGARAAEGWDGDAFRLYRKGEKHLLAWTTIWDTEIDAREFTSAYTKAIRTKLKGLDEVKADGNGISHESESGWVEIKRDGRRVFIAEGGSEAEAKGVVGGMLAEATFEEMKPGVGAKED
ncbi:MAG: hypothetical protein FD180_3208 [Planctomycetota bacterium]|nr:MAG: hypothetical protein FD180_3208 [Planctomycetota bacterium]